MKTDALGLVEVRGLVTAIETADAMLKAAHVRLLRQHQIHPGLISLIVEGDLGACRAAVDAGTAAAARLGEVVSRLEIGRPDSDTQAMILSLIASSRDKADRKQAKAQPKPPSLPVVRDEDETSPPERPAETDPVTEEASTLRAVMFTFITKSPRGRSWAEIVKYFPEYADHGYILEQMVEEGTLRKKGQRYLRNSG